MLEMTKCPTCGTERRVGAHCKPCQRDGATERRREWREKNPRLPRAAILTEEGRLCRTCGERKSDDCFGKDPRSKNGRAWRCKACALKQHAAWRAANPEHMRDQSRGEAKRRRKRNSEKERINQRKWHIKTKYGISTERAEAILADQGGKCPVCEMTISFTFDRVERSAAHIDHNHVTGSIRGILCSSCNTAIGKLKDSEMVLWRAILYLRQHRAQATASSTSTHPSASSMS